MNELRKKYKEETKQPITEKPTGNFDYFKDEYVFWLEEQLEAINFTHCCTELNHDFETGEDVWLTEKKIVEISSFCEDSERMEIIEDGKYKIVDKDKLNKVV
tara:strand:+ start:120 stop:425 length:306 start_codon:yes stop_codon:yes gene_type:complete